MTVVYPEGTPTLGQTTIAIVTTVASMAAPKVATEINGATSVSNATCFFTADGWTPTGSQGKQTKKRRLCSKTDVESLSTAVYSLGSLKYIHNPQEADAHASNEVRGALVPGTKVYIIERQGGDAETDAWAAGDHVLTHYVELGEQFRLPDPDENGEFFIQQEVAYVNSGPVAGILAA